MDLLDLLRSRPAMMSGSLAHKYLKNTLLQPSERAAAGRLRERPKIVRDIMETLREIEDTFYDGYDPGAFVSQLLSFQNLHQDLRGRLLVAVRRDYTNRFCPKDRIDKFKQSAAAFLTALCLWHDHVAAAGVDADSAPLWEALRGRAAALRDLLEDRELSTRWIP